MKLNVICGRVKGKVGSCSLMVWVLLCVVGLFMLSGCKKDSVVTLDAETENWGNGSKVYLDNADYACWESGDMVNINGEEYEVVVNNGSHISDVIASDSYVAVFPSKGAVMQGVGAAATMSFPMPKTTKWSDVNKNANGQQINNPMVARLNASTGILSFKNVGALLGVRVKSTESDLKVMEIVVTSSVALSGTASVSASDVLTVSGEGTVEMVNIDEAITAEGKVYYLNVPPVAANTVTFSIEVRLQKVGAKRYKYRRFTQKIGIGKNEVGIIPIDLGNSVATNEFVSEDDRLLGGGTKDNPHRIYTKQDLDILMNNAEYYDKYIVQENGLVWDNTDGVWNGIGNSTTSFTGNYDGKGNSIDVNTNENSGSSAIFGKVGANATIQNVQRDGEVRFSAGQKIVGGVVGQVDGSGVKMQGCTNNASMYGDEIWDGWELYEVGGVCGSVSANSTDFEMTDCHSTGVLTSTTSGTNTMNMGGLCGKIGANGAKISKCTSSTKLQFRGHDGNVGGLVGDMPNSCVIEECKNTGFIESTNKNGGLINYDYDFRVGGLVGNVSGENITIRNCGNDGTIKCNGGAGLVGSCQSCTIQNCYANGEFIEGPGGVAITKGMNSGFVGKFTTQLVIDNSYSALKFVPETTNYGICYDGDVSKCSFTRVYLAKEMMSTDLLGRPVAHYVGDVRNGGIPGGVFINANALVSLKQQASINSLYKDWELGDDGYPRIKDL